MTDVVIIERPSADAFSDAEIAEVLDALYYPSPSTAYFETTPAVDGLFDIARSAATSLGIALDADHHNIHVEVLRWPAVSPPGSYISHGGNVMFPGAPVGGRINVGARTEMLVQLDDPGDYTGGQFEIEVDDGSFVTIPRSKGCVAVWKMGRRYRWTKATAGTPRLLRLLSVVQSAWAGADAGWRAG